MELNKEGFMKRSPALLVVFNAFLFTLVGVTSHTALAEGQGNSINAPAWQNSVEIYGMALNIRGDTTLLDQNLEVNVDPKFILDTLEMTAMVRFESIYDNQWGYYIDYSFMKLNGETNNVLDNTNNLVLKGDIDIRQGVLEAKGFKRYDYGDSTLDCMVGLRWWDNDIDMQLYRKDNNAIFSDINFEDDWIDFVVGVRWIKPINQDWLFYISADAGMGSDTDFTTAIQTGARYQINSWSDLNLAYKSTWVDYDNEDNFAYDTASQGFLIGWAAYF
ncbi:hypothetical protein SJ2017_0566 [Shewanella japonica]|uniref:DUF481 domain-containing protein n=2 Tax=Shewanella japonica TaxID=93973 RepID=A0ABN4YDV7_9GAMM|nr:hypothetical protein SJ2017_0566 [Shewanella japonica]